MLQYKQLAENNLALKCFTHSLHATGEEDRLYVCRENLVVG